MARFQTESLPQDKFLLVAVNLLHKTFVEATRTEAKTVYQQISAGDIVHLTTVQLEDKSTARFNVSLSHSEFRGRLNYSAFRASVGALVSNITQALQDKRELKVFTAQNGGNAMIFGVTAVTREDDSANVMVMAADMDGQEGATTLQLMYLDPTQFSPQQTPA
jgi:hypothetical protein